MIQVVDDTLKIGGKLSAIFTAEQNFKDLKEDEAIGFEIFYDGLVKWTCS